MDPLSKWTRKDSREMLGARDVQRPSNNFVQRTMAHSAVMGSCEGDVSEGGQSFNFLEQFEQNRGYVKAPPRSSFQLGAGEDEEMKSPCQHVRSHRGRLLYGKLGLLNCRVRPLSPWAASTWRRGCCFGLLGGSNQRGEANLFFEDFPIPASVTIQDYDSTLADKGEQEVPATFQRQLVLACAAGVPCITQPPQVPSQGVQHERLARSALADSQVEPAQDFAAGVPFSVILPQVPPQGVQHDQVDHGESADSQVVPDQDFAVGVPSCATVNQVPLQGLQHERREGSACERLECSVLTPSQIEPAQDFAAGVPFSVILPQVPPQGAQHGQVAHDESADSQVVPDQDFAAGVPSCDTVTQVPLQDMQHERREGSACTNCQDLASQTFVSGVQLAVVSHQVPPQGVQSGLAACSAFRGSCVQFTCVFDLEHEDWQHRLGSPQAFTTPSMLEGLKESLRPMIMQLVQDAIKEALAAAFGTSPVVPLLPPSDNAPTAEPKPKRQRNGKGKGASATPGESGTQLEPSASDSKGTGHGSRAVTLQKPAGASRGDGKEVQARPAAMTVQQNARRLGPWPTLTVRRRHRLVTRAGNV